MRFITVHNTGNASLGAGARSHASYIKGDTAANTPVSWHYTVDERDIVRHIPDSEEAFHAGDGSGDGNRRSIGIEICMNSDGDLLKATDNAAMLAAELCKRYGISVENVVQHNRWNGKNCPQMLRNGRPYNWETFIAKIRAAAAPKPADGAAAVRQLAEKGRLSNPEHWLELLGKIERKEESYTRNDVRWLSDMFVKWAEDVG
jgi:N-acetylmuramoyl-L-alanine amidase